jgi:pimeloyl-ACP methyl ester carboxylesterase
MLGVALGLSACASVQAPRAGVEQGLARATVGAPIDEAREQSLIGGHDRPGRIVELARGAPGRPATLTIHGINASPADVEALTEAARSGGGAVATFAWDDRHRRLTDSARDLAGELEAFVAAHPGAPLRIDAHSMGGRVAVAALGELAARGGLEGVPVTLRLIASPLGGLESANGARHAPGFLGGLIGGLRPGIDMGTTSEFQRGLEAITLPRSVRVEVHLGGADPIASPDDAALRRVAARLGADVVVAPGRDHVGMVDHVARLPRGPRAP